MERQRHRDQVLQAAAGAARPPASTPPATVRTVRRTVESRPDRLRSACPHAANGPSQRNPPTSRVPKIAIREQQQVIASWLLSRNCCQRVRHELRITSHLSPRVPRRRRMVSVWRAGPTDWTIQGGRRSTSGPCTDCSNSPHRRAACDRPDGEETPPRRRGVRPPDRCRGEKLASAGLVGSPRSCDTRLPWVSQRCRARKTRESQTAVGVLVGGGASCGGNARGQSELKPSPAHDDGDDSGLATSTPGLVDSEDRRVEDRSGSTWRLAVARLPERLHAVRICHPRRRR